MKTITLSRCINLPPRTLNRPRILQWFSCKTRSQKICGQIQDLSELILAIYGLTISNSIYISSRPCALQFLLIYFKEGKKNCVRSSENDLTAPPQFPIS